MKSKTVDLVSMKTLIESARNASLHKISNSMLHFISHSLKKKNEEDAARFD